MRKQAADDMVTTLVIRKKTSVYQRTCIVPLTLIRLNGSKINRNQFLKLVTIQKQRASSVHSYGMAIVA